MSGEFTGWRKSRRSANNGACLEAGHGPWIVAVRDSNDPDGPVLTFSAGAWQRFTAGLKAP